MYVMQEKKKKKKKKHAKKSREREYDVAALRVVAILESCLVLERRAWPKF